MLTHRAIRLRLEVLEDLSLPSPAVPTDFPAGVSTVESFEGLADGANSPLTAGTGFFSPGAVSNFTFASGFTLTKPIPNPGNGNNGVIVGDWSKGAANFALGTNGAITSAADIPNGTAFLGLDANSANGPIGFTFAADVGAVGASVTAFDGANVTLKAFDASGNLLETVAAASANRTLWTARDASAFIGIKRAGIRRVEINANFVAMDLLETRPVLPALVGVGPFAVGADAGGTAAATLYNADGTTKFSLNAFPGFTGGVRTAVADFNNDGVPDLAVGTGAGIAARVRILNGANQAVLLDIPVFEGFAGGVFLAAGDLTGDGIADLVVTPDQGGGPRVLIFRGGDFQQVASFFGIDDAAFRGGARAAVGDLNGDGRADLAVAAGFSGGPRVAAFDGRTVTTTRTKLFNDIFVFESSLRNGAFVAVGDVNGDGFADLISGAGPGGAPRVLTFSGADLIANRANASAVLTNFFAGNSASRNGIRVAAKNLDGDLNADLVVGDGTGDGSHVTSYAGKNFSGGSAPAALSFNAFPGFIGGVFVG